MDKILARVGALTVTDAEIDEFLHGLGQRGRLAKSRNFPD